MAKYARLETSKTIGLQASKLLRERCGAHLTSVADNAAAITCSSVVERIQRTLLKQGIPANKARATIARTCGITPQSVMKWFNGQTRYPRADHLALLARHFSADLYWLILGDDVSSSAPGSNETARQS
jgi:hypothetical protein